KNGALQINATKVGKDTALAQIVKVVEEAQGSKADIQRLADKISGVFVPIVVLIAVITFLVWYFIVTPVDFRSSLIPMISMLFVPIVLLLSFITFLVLYFIVTPGDFRSSLIPMISILVIACPCALGLATPTSIMAGSGRAAEMGMLFKGGEHLENTQSIDTVV